MGEIEQVPSQTGEADDLRAVVADFLIEDLQALGYQELQALVAEEECKGQGRDRDEVLAELHGIGHRELVARLLPLRAGQGHIGEARGILQVRPEGFGFLRFARHNYRSGPDDIYVSPNQVRRLRLRDGDQVVGPARPPREDEGYFALLRIDQVNGLGVAQLFQRVPFRDLNPVLPTRRLLLGHAGDELTGLMDRWAPLALGHRVALHVPANCPRVDLLAAVVAGIRHNHGDVVVVVLQVGERPEDAVALHDRLAADAGVELVTSSFDEPPAVQVATADLVLARARRLLEVGRDVVLIVDSLTRLVRATNLVVPHSGKIISPELDAAALQPAKELFASARQAEGAGSLTVLATVLHDTGTRIDEIVAEELRHRANADVVLDQELCEEHGHLGLDVARTRTRREDNPLPPDQQARLREARRTLPTDLAAALAAARAQL